MSAKGPNGPRGGLSRLLHFIALAALLFLILPLVVVIPCSFEGGSTMQFPPRSWSIDFLKVLAPEATESLSDPIKLSKLFQIVKLKSDEVEMPSLRLVLFGASPEFVAAARYSFEAAALVELVQEEINFSYRHASVGEPYPQWQLDWLRHEMQSSQSVDQPKEATEVASKLSVVLSKLYKNHPSLRAVFMLSRKRLYLPSPGQEEPIPGYSAFASFYALQQPNARWRCKPLDKLDRDTAGTRAEWPLEFRNDDQTPHVVVSLPIAAPDASTSLPERLRKRLPGLISQLNFEGVPFRFESQPTGIDRGILAWVKSPERVFPCISLMQPGSIDEITPNATASLETPIKQLLRDYTQARLLNLRSDPSFRLSTLCLSKDGKRYDHVLDGIEIQSPAAPMDEREVCRQRLRWTNCQPDGRFQVSEMTIKTERLQTRALRCAFFNTKSILSANLACEFPGSSQSIDLKSPAEEEFLLPGAIRYEASVQVLRVPTATKTAVTEIGVENGARQELFRLSDIVSNQYAIERQKYSGFVDVTAHTVINLLNSTNPVNLLTHLKSAVHTAGNLHSTNSATTSMFEIAKSGLKEIELKKNAAIGALRWNQLLAGSLREKHLAKQPYSAAKVLEHACSYFGSRGVGCIVDWRNEAFARRLIFPEKYFPANMAAYTVYEFLKNLSDHGRSGESGGIMDATLSDGWATIGLENEINSDETGLWEQTPDGIPIPANRRNDIAEGNSFLVNLVRFLRNRKDMRVRIEVDALPH